MKDAFLRQAGLILRILPLIHQEQVFALKGGTAINFFVRDLPRLSVDIDLVYLPVTERTEALAEINQKLHGIAEKIRRMFPTAVIQESGLKLILRLGEATVKIEPNQVLRGSVHPAEVKELVPEAKKHLKYRWTCRLSLRPTCMAERFVLLWIDSIRETFSISNSCWTMKG